MTMDKDEGNCSTTSPDAVRAAAAASLAWTPPNFVTTARWVRDGER